jgi:hypothetical protein
MMALQKMQRKAAAGNGNGAGPPPVGPDGQPLPPEAGGLAPATDPAMMSKIRGEIAYREAKIQSLNAQSQARIQIEQNKAAQKMAIEDAKAAASMMQKR